MGASRSRGLRPPRLRQVPPVPDDPGGNPGHDGPLRHLPGHHGTHAHHGMIPDAHPIGDAGIGTDPDIRPDDDPL